MSRFVRPSKYRHVYGQPYKKECTYENVKASSAAGDSDTIQVNTEYFSLNYQTSGGGAFLVCPLSRVGKLPDLYPLVRAHSATVLDTSWSPFDPNLIASVGEDCKVQITRIDPAILNAAFDTENKNNNDAGVPDILPIQGYKWTHSRKAGHVMFHPTAAHILVSASNEVKIWDVDRPTAARIELDTHPDVVYSMAWNSTGSLLATICRDRKLRLFDPRASTSPVRIADSHTGMKSSRVVWLGDLDRIVTTGFDKSSSRQIFLWDVAKLGSTGDKLKELSIDSSSGTLLPYWCDNNILFVAGKGDGNIRYYEYEGDDLVYLNEYKSTEPQRGIGYLPRRAVNVSECEIARAYKLTGNAVEPIPFIVPRKSDAFQSDIYPPAVSSKPALTAEEYFQGKTQSPVTINLDSQSENASAPAAAPAATYSTPAPVVSSPVASNNNNTASSSPPPPASTSASPAKPSSPEPTPRKQDSSPPPSTISPSNSQPPPTITMNNGHYHHQNDDMNATAQDKEHQQQLENLLSENESLRSQLKEKNVKIDQLEVTVQQLVSAQRKAADLLKGI